ncbi:hypothetical protein N7465_001938, partial [Penicillium sp. CMV-2018d]
SASSLDIEMLRKHLQIAKWYLVFGGSWGSILSLLYPQAYPEMVGSLILQGIFTVRKYKLEFSRGSIGAAKIFPKALKHLSIMFLKRIGQDRMRYTTIWLFQKTTIQNRWDLSIGTLKPEPEGFARLEDDAWLEPRYFANGGFLEEGQILKVENLRRISHITTTVIQGRYRIVSAPPTAWDLHKRSMTGDCFGPLMLAIVLEPGTQGKLFEVCDELAELDFTDGV